MAFRCASSAIPVDVPSAIRAGILRGVSESGSGAPNNTMGHASGSSTTGEEQARANPWEARPSLGCWGLHSNRHGTPTVRGQSHDPPSQPALVEERRAIHSQSILWRRRAELISKGVEMKRGDYLPGEPNHLGMRRCLYGVPRFAGRGSDRGRA